MPLPESFIQHLRDFGYHPRSNKHSNALAVAIVEDLLDSCEPLARSAAMGRITYDLNMQLRVRTTSWNVDLVIGTPPSPTEPVDARITRATPASVLIAIEIKGVMTEHRKAVQNRKRDFEAHHEHVHNYNPTCIAGGVMVINAAERFRSPLRQAPTPHGMRDAVDALVSHCIVQMRNVTESGGGSGYGIDAKCCIVVEADNIDLGGTGYRMTPPAPRPGDPLHYDSFIQKLCQLYVNRFGRV